MEPTIGGARPGDAAATTWTPRVLQLAATAAEACRRLEHPDLAARLDAVLTRLSRPQPVVCVVGEFKQGKSTLVNALLDREVCPIDDTGTTTMPTWVHPAEQPFGLVRRPADGRVADEQVGPDAAARRAIREGDQAALVEIGIAEPLATGPLGFVDTPGVGGLAPGRRTATLSFLEHADAFILTTDACGELSGPELEFVHDAHLRCPNGFVALTKIDLRAEWRRIAEIDRSLLLDLGVPVPVLPVSAALWFASRRRRDDPSLADESGLPGLRGLLRGGAADGAGRLAARRALADITSVTDLLAGTLDADRRVTADPAIADARAGELATAEERLTALRSRGARWATTLQDRITDLSAGIDARLRDGIRSIIRDTDRRFEDSDPAGEWAAFTEHVQARLSELGTGVADEIAAAAARIGAEIGGLIDDAAPELVALAPAQVAVEWEAGDRALTPDPGRFSGVFTAVRGGSSGIITLGVVGGLAGLAMAAPMSIAAGLAFGARQYVEDRKRVVERRRREARIAVQQHLRVAQTELSSEHRRLLQEAHRALRDHFSARIAELDAGYRRSIEAARAARQRDTAAREARLGQLDQWIAAIGELRSRTAALTAAMTEDGG